MRYRNVLGLCIWTFVLGICLVFRNGQRVSAQASTTITIDNTIKHQTMEGFGATHGSLVYGGAMGDVLSPDLRNRLLTAVFGQVKLTTGNLDQPLLETANGWDGRQNDNTDPFVINMSGFDAVGAQNLKTKMVDIAQPLGFDNYYLAHMVNNKWAAPWMLTIKSQDYNKYLDEAAEQVLATANYWKTQYGIVPRYIAPLNEPTSGNGELAGGLEQEVVDIVKRAGARLAQEGFTNIKFVVPNEETVTRTHTVAQRLLSDPIARQYVAAIGYHAYPYGSSYSYIPNILSQSGSGNPNQSEINSRIALKQLAQQYGVQLWMTEISHGTDGGSIDIRSMDALRGRAIHIHDELEYADASAYFGMSSIWDRVSEREHFGGDAGLFNKEGHIAIADQNDNSVHITGMGYAIGHYARFIKRGAIRIDSRSSDPLVQVSAFNDPAQGKLVTVMINNANTPKTISIALNGIGVQGSISGEQSTQAQFWKPITSISPATASSFSITLPAFSVTTVSGVVSGASVSKSADANGDGKVDGLDYIVWLTHYGKSLSGKVNGDYNGDGKVDGLDYIVWLTNYGR